MKQFFKDDTPVFTGTLTFDQKKDLIREEIRKQLDKGIVPASNSFPSYYDDQISVWLEDVLDLSWFNRIIRMNSSNPLIELIGHHPSHLQIIQRYQNTSSKLALSLEDWELMLQVFCIKNNVEWNFSHPFVSFELIFNSLKFRLSLCHTSLTYDHTSKFFIRSIGNELLFFKDFGVPNELESTLKQIIENGDNFIISGSTGSGKTSFCSLLLSHLSEEEHPIIIEDIPEIYFKHPQKTQLIISEQKHQTIPQLIKYALRMTPTRIIVGELRGEEVIGFLTAMNTGHRGVSSTIHASHAYDAIHRLAQLFCLYGNISTIKYEQVLGMVTRNIQYVIHLEGKKVKEIVRILGLEEQSPIYERIYG